MLDLKYYVWNIYDSCQIILGVCLPPQRSVSRNNLVFNKWWHLIRILHDDITINIGVQPVGHSLTSLYLRLQPQDKKFISINNRSMNIQRNWSNYRNTNIKSTYCTIIIILLIAKSATIVQRRKCVRNFIRSIPSIIFIYLNSFYLIDNQIIPLLDFNYWAQ